LLHDHAQPLVEHQHWYALASMALLQPQHPNNYDLDRCSSRLRLSFLADAGGWQKWFFSGLALLMSLFLILYLIKAPRKATLLSFGLALVLGGAVGNLIDRLLHGHVIDFIHVHYADVWHYPIFNIADIGISIGVLLIVIDMLFLEKKR
ncbi:signal peptidase II, partial [Pseudoalteromonas sp. SIMBA_153]